MCEANAYVVDKDGEESLLMDQVNSMKIENGKLIMENIFYERKIFDGKIKELALLEHKILLESSHI